MAVRVVVGGTTAELATGKGGLGNCGLTESGLRGTVGASPPVASIPARERPGPPCKPKELAPVAGL
eukprot:1285269-Prorocentrum_lima.AAC.1